MDTPLGRVTHRYAWVNGRYYRRPLQGSRWQVWNGMTWVGYGNLPAAA